MAAEFKTRTEPFGVRLPFWIGLLLAVLATLVFYRVRYPDPQQNPGTTSPVSAAGAPAQVERNHTTSSPVAPTLRRALPASLPQLAVETGLVGPDVREHEPIPVLINELFSPDAQVRMTAAIRLSRRSFHATEAIPVLKKLAPEEPDPNVRQIMKEAILNIRGYVPPPFDGPMQRLP